MILPSSILFCLIWVVFVSRQVLARQLMNHTKQHATNSTVHYELVCQSDPIFCDKVDKAVAAAIDELTKVVNIKTSLLILVKYHSFCRKTCANDTYGWGSPTSQFTLPFEDGADLNYVYPQALAKQLAPYNSTSVWAQYDVEIEINSDLYTNISDDPDEINVGKYWFDDHTTEIAPEQIDFRYIVLHELLHGMGFLSAWAAYFWTKASPFRKLVDGVIDPLELQLVTPGPYWFINQDTGPAYVTGFQHTMIFDKYLVNMNRELNTTQTTLLSDIAMDMQNFCVSDNNAFIVNFLHAFNAANQSTTAHKLWLSLSEPETLQFMFQPPHNHSQFSRLPYLNQTYRNMTLLTGNDLFQVFYFEQTDPTINRPGLMISHLDDQYQNTVDFLMTQHYHMGQTLESLVQKFYQEIPVLQYNQSLPNGTLLQARYQSPIGPGILRVLDSIGYSTVLTSTSYTSDGNPKAPRSRSICDDNTTNHNLKSGSVLTSMASISLPSFYLIFLIYLCLQSNTV
ncbi:Uncharacterized protein PB7E8.01 [Choanephora cucurbitarum]|uniref:Uncharacterized protein PB7E8.01 n=1 Tax=Choanephora cucurbitarum TaxID=101091 RepID=A0A1C7N4L1_9FUNG|nr:Uncharacterized protein PB7E8.01 [Choanephora cucurbitarum]